MYKLKAGLTWCLAAEEDDFLLLQTAQLVVETQKQVKKFSFLLPILCFLGCCQVLLSFD